MEVFTMAMLAALVIKIVSTIKAAGKDTNMVVTQVTTWVVGIAVLFLASQADLTAALVVFSGAPALGDLDAASLVVAGLALGSTGSFAYDYKKARDNTDSSSEPKLLSASRPRKK